MDVTSFCLARHLSSRVDNLVQLLDQFVDLKFRPERQVVADLFFPFFWGFILKYDITKGTTLHFPINEKDSRFTQAIFHKLNIHRDEIFITFIRNFYERFLSKLL